MKVTYINWDDNNNNTTNDFPSDQHSYFFGTLQGDVYGRKLEIWNDEHSAKVAMYSMYLFCCGMREIGSIWISRGVNVEKFREEFINLLQADYNYGTIGSLTYTRTKYGSNYNLQSNEVVRFIEEWPGASAGAWWYNPNSGNMVQQWTLPLNQPSKDTVEDDMYEEDEE
jgi:hypothetical protein